MRVKISPSSISGSLHAPRSKSSMQRALAAALLHTGSTQILHTGHSNDDKAALDIIHSLGAKTEISGNKCTIHSTGAFHHFTGEQTIHCGESGLALRMFAPIAALADTEILLTGEGSLQQRPMHFFDEIFPQFDISISSADGRLPIKIKGPLQPKDITIDGSLSSQFLTGLLFAFGAAAKETVTITVNDLKSKPYIDLTLDVMKHFGYDISQDHYRQFFIHPKKANREDISYTVEGDWSSASFLLVAAAVAGEIKLTGLDTGSSQADKAILSVLKDCGADIEIMPDHIRVKEMPLKPFHFDATDSPDLFPPLVALAAYSKGVSVIKGISRLAAKESDRAKTLQDVFGKAGIQIVLADDQMSVYGGGTITGAVVSSHHDHRIAMAAAVAALGATGEMIIEEAEAINKSYPGFFDDLQKAGASINIIES